MATPNKPISLDQAERLYSPEQVDEAVAEMAAAIGVEIADKNPIIVTLMNGGLIATAQLLKYFDFPLQQDYMHLTRYGDSTVGGELTWVHRPTIKLENRTVLLVDDLLDKGITLKAAAEFCYENKVKELFSAVIVVKQVADRHSDIKVDYFALEAPDRYLFGYGMDIESYWRNAPGIYAVKD